MIFKNFINEKLAERLTDRLLNHLEDMDFASVKHALLQIKWMALRDKDDKEYDRAEALYDCMERLEKFSMKYKEV